MEAEAEAEGGSSRYWSRKLGVEVLGSGFHVVIFNVYDPRWRRVFRDSNEEEIKC